jgi:site-specific DNA-methyltransferase (adenine-specific)
MINLSSMGILDTAHLRPSLTALTNRVWCMDALALLKCLPDKSVDVTVTSPPYNLDWQVRNGQGRGMLKGSKWVKGFSEGYENYDDKMPEDQYQAWIRNVVAECLRVSKGLVWINHKTRFREGVGIHPLSFLPFPFYSEIVWNRGNSMILNSRRFAPSHEFVYGFGKPHYWNDNSNVLMTVWRINPPQGDIDHPCPYPESLVERLITASCPPDGVVFDPFMGSGTTALAAKRSGRQYLGCDNSLKYVEMARQRLALPMTLPLFAHTA